MKIWLPLLLVPFVAGCLMRSYHHSDIYRSTVAATPGLHLPDEQQMLFQYHIRDRQAALESKSVVLVFHGLTPEQKELFHFQGKEQAVQIAGDGTSTVSVTCTTDKRTVAFQSHYADGTNTLQFALQTVRFIKGGRLLLAGDQSIDLSKGRKTVHLRDGKVVVE
jgi:hypothetical protein